MTELQLIPFGRVALLSGVFVYSMPMSYDGCTSGPREYCGFIGKQLTNCDNESTVVDQLSTNQKYLYEICKAVQIGYCSP